MIPICLDSQTKLKISLASPFSWALTSSLTYLGIQLMSLSSGILRHNYSLFLTKLSKLLYVSLLRPHLHPGQGVLYTFRTLPLPFLLSQLRTIQNIINNLIWRKKNPCICSLILCASRKLSGMGAPNIKLYYKATILAQPNNSGSPSSNTTWKQIKSQILGSDPK